MKIYKYKTAKIPMINNKTKETYFETKRVYGHTCILHDKHGNEYQLFLQDKVENWLDLRLNNPKIGVLVEGVFWAIGRFENDWGDLYTRFLEIDPIELAKNKLRQE